MSEHFITFSTPMVQAEREDRKTQTRRIVQPLIFGPAESHESIGAFRFEGGGWRARAGDFNAWSNPVPCPYGKPGDILKVREACWMWCEKVRDGLTPKGKPKFRYVPIQSMKPVYVADRPKKPEPGDKLKKHAPHLVWRLKIPRFVPAWAVRTRLEIVSIKVERLNDISEDDAKAEGVPRCSATWGVDYQWNNGKTARDGFINLWESIHGADSWAENPWVWVIEFKRA